MFLITGLTLIGEISFPATFRIDYVRIYQPLDAINTGCDPEDYPTYDYIQQHLNIYENVNLTSFEDGGYKLPKNTLTDVEIKAEPGTSTADFVILFLFS